MLFCFYKKGQGPKAHLSPSKVQVLAKRRQISAGCSFKARSPNPAQLSLLRELDAQDPVGPQAPQAARMVGARSQGSLPPLLGCKAGMGERLITASRPGPMCGLGKGSGALQDIAPQPVPRPPCRQLTHWPEAR